MEQSPAGFQQLGEHLVHRDQSCTFDLESPSKAKGKALKGKGKDLKKKQRERLLKAQLPPGSPSSCLQPPTVGSAPSPIPGLPNCPWDTHTSARKG